jgi:trimethylamine--corrinoid protein Co-methyltransferase
MQTGPDTTRRKHPNGALPPHQYRCDTPFEPLTADEITAIHAATLGILADTGLVMRDESALDLLAAHGAQVDRATQVARFPAALVEQALAACPAAVELRSRDGLSNILLDGRHVQFAACSGMRILDPASGATRPGTAVDAERTARLCDALPILSAVNTGLGEIADRPRELNLEWHYAICCRASGKVLGLSAMADSVPWGIRMAEVAGQGAYVAVSSASPLAWDNEQIEALRVAAGAGTPVVIQSMASPGTTAPVTLVGAAVVMNAEILGLLTLAQLLRPGLGTIYSCFTLPLDMRLGTLASGSPELALLNAVAAQLSRRYGVGSMVYGPNTDAKSHDEQAGYEKMLQWLITAMSGTGLLWGAGMIENHSLWSDAQLMVDAEMCGLVGRLLRGVRADGLTDDAALIAEVGHFPNTYLGKKHTSRLYRAEHYLPLLSSRESYEQWLQLEPRQLLARGDALAQELLERHQAPTLSDDQEHEIAALLEHAARDKGLPSSLG